MTDNNTNDLGDSFDQQLLEFDSGNDINISDISPANTGEDISDDGVENFNNDTLDNILKSGSEEAINQQADSTENQIENTQESTHGDDELGLPSSLMLGDSSEFVNRSEMELGGGFLNNIPEGQPLAQDQLEDLHKLEQQQQQQEQEPEQNENSNIQPIENLDNTDLGQSNLSENENTEDNQPGYLQQQPQEAPEDDEKDKKYTKSYKAFLERNDNSALRHRDPSIPRPQSPTTIRYKLSPTPPLTPQKKGLPECHSPRLSELFEKSIKANQPKPESPRMSSSPQISEATITLATGRNERFIDMIVGRKSKMNHMNFTRIMRKFNIRSTDTRNKILERCGGAPPSNDDSSDSSEDSMNGTNNNDNNNNESTMDANILRALLKEAAAGQGGDELVKEIRPAVKAALLDMKEPIVSPMTQKQRNQMGFDQTLRSSSRMVQNSPR
ncbi:hypothetical protein TRFO_17905 [Tritrichomonas foetus]|uniref:Uncharacterized protein n=1 Tax=Tritrichomonas foetus TaxID=1144522 RepID=A0A1J4KLZ5_9EUKA|nr:hypothetical protein TRFO_17905 [Tritrichomonas foetus]|eukprot:OHT12321.1 hypothetical protein TRFO_17905 [Tritrichomonas foetus]